MSAQRAAQTDGELAAAAGQVGLYSDRQNIDADCERLLRNTKKQVKQMMEEAVTKKFIHEESSSLVSLCVAVDACLTHNLKRRALGLFKTNSSTALIQKLAKSHREAQEVLDLVGEQERLKSASARRESDAQLARTPTKSPLKQVASNSSVLKRNMWIKYALIEKKLVSIVEHLAANANRYYEPDALLSNYLCAQILCSLLVGPSALEFSRSNTADCYQFEEPNAEELMKRHKLANPIACLCNKQHASRQSAGDKDHCLAVSSSAPARSISQGERKSQDSSAAEQVGGRQKNWESRRRPLALKTSLKRGTLVTDCHHYSCQEFSEHQSTRGYSFLSTLSNRQASSTGGPSSGQAGGVKAASVTAATSNGLASGSALGQDSWTVWSPRMLHETLHQNSRSSLLYAKNNVLLETQPGQTVAGYLSLHQLGKAELVLKWIPNQMINGSQGTNPAPGGTPTATACDAKQPPASANQQVAGAETDVNNEKEGGAEQQSSTVAGKAAGQSVALESSYLELVICLPVSRIVLLHCQFGRERRNTETSPQRRTNVQQPIKNEQTDNKVEELDSTPSPRVPSTEDTLILIEADGVQLSPFKFPKGALRVFLSCLESGLRPDKYLDPAINFDESNNDNDSFDPLDETLRSEPFYSKSSIGSPAPDLHASSEPSRLDTFLKRLPSLKRRSPRLEEPPPISSIFEDPTPLGGEQAASEQVPSISNYVYRIVSFSQPDWVALPTPPHSAMSIGSFVTNSQQQQHLKQVSSFRWSLSRLAKFSNRYTNSGSTSSSSAFGNSWSLTVNDSISSNQTVNTESIGEHNQESLTKQPANRGDVDANKSREEQVKQTDSSRDLVRIEAKLHDLKQSTSGEVLHTLRTHSVQTLCETMRKQLQARAFYGWLAYCRKTRIVRKHLIKLVKETSDVALLTEEGGDFASQALARERLDSGMTKDIWCKLMAKRATSQEEELSREVNQLVYYGGIESDELRREIWPYLLEHYKFKDSDEAKRLRDKAVREAYESCWRDWIKIERVVKERDHELLAANIAKASKTLLLKEKQETIKETEIVSGAKPASNNNGKNNDNNNNGNINNHDEQPEQSQDQQQLDSLQRHPASDSQIESEEHQSDPVESDQQAKVESMKNAKGRKSQKDVEIAAKRRRRRARLESTGSVGSDASITDQFGNNIHRIDKDVQRCDRSFWYFKEAKNLNKLRNIMCSYVWQHLDVGYVQGMCDLAAPFLVIFDDELLAFSCFSQLMKRMVANFPHGCAMDQHFENLQYLMQVLDPKLFEVLQSNGDYAHFYFCYRWLLLDFKRELAYEDVYRVWETIWSARHIATDNFVVFMALAMVRYYRDIIIENNMDFTDTIKFFNEMAERHDAKRITALARDCIVELQSLIRNQSK